MKLSIAFLLLAFPAYSQTLRSSHGHVAFSVAAGKSQGTVSIAYGYDWSLGARKRLVVGSGVRFTNYFGRSQNYVTAPAQLTSNRTGPLVFFTANVTENMDSLLVGTPRIAALNAFINLGYRFNEKLQLGFNIDAIGLSFGPTKTGTYINGTAVEIRTTAQVTKGNVLLVSDNDRGSLNSELYARYRLSNRWSIQSGAQFLFTEYTTATKVQQFPQPNDRFRKKSLMLAFGVYFDL